MRLLKFRFPRADETAVTSTTPRAPAGLTYLDAGVDMYDLQLAMGHSSSDTTMRYDRARARLQRAPSLAVEEIIRASSNPAA